jgi:hypothetical protein
MVGIRIFHPYTFGLPVGTKSEVSAYTFHQSIPSIDDHGQPCSGNGLLAFRHAGQSDRSKRHSRTAGGGRVSLISTEILVLSPKPSLHFSIHRRYHVQPGAFRRQMVCFAKVGRLPVGQITISRCGL